MRQKYKKDILPKGFTILLQAKNRSPIIDFEAERLGFFGSIGPAFRFNLIGQTPAYEDFHCNRG